MNSVKHKTTEIILKIINLKRNNLCYGNKLTKHIISGRALIPDCCCWSQGFFARSNRFRWGVHGLGWLVSCLKLLGSIFTTWNEPITHSIIIRRVNSYLLFMVTVSRFDIFFCWSELKSNQFTVDVALTQDPVYLFESV